MSETCDDAPPCDCGADVGERHGRGCAAGTFPNLITHAETTGATVPDCAMTAHVHDALAGKGLAPGRSYLDSGYLSADLVVSGYARHGIALIGPLLAGTSAQARAGNGYARTDFDIDYDNQSVTARGERNPRPGTRVPSAARTRSSSSSPRPAAAPALSVTCAPRAGGGSSPCSPAPSQKPRPPRGTPRKPSLSRPTAPAGPASGVPCVAPDVERICPRDHGAAGVSGGLVHLGDRLLVTAGRHPDPEPAVAVPAGPADGCVESPAHDDRNRLRGRRDDLSLMIWPSKSTGCPVRSCRIACRHSPIRRPRVPGSIPQASISCRC